jgi:hypothetical protein
VLKWIPKKYFDVQFKTQYTSNQKWIEIKFLIFTCDWKIVWKAYKSSDVEFSCQKKENQAIK